MAAPNDAVRVTEQCWERCILGELESAAELMHVDFVHDDRRRGLTNVVSSRADTIEMNRLVGEMGMTPSFEPLRVDDDRAALVRAVFSDEAGNEVVTLQILESDDQGLRTCCISFDADDFDRADDEFARRVAGRRS